MRAIRNFGFFLRYRSMRLSAILFAGVTLFFLCLWAITPSFGGRTIHHWIDRLGDPIPTEGQIAINQIGPRAIPYLVNAARIPEEWETGLRSKLPAWVKDRIVDLRRVHRVRTRSLEQIARILRQEAERNGRLPLHGDPLTAQTIAFLKSELRQGYVDDITEIIETAGPNKTNLFNDLYLAWKTVPLGRRSWKITLVLTEMHSPLIVDDLLPSTAATNHYLMRAAAFRALALNGRSNEKVCDALRVGLTSDDPNVRQSAIYACAQLDFAPPESLQLIKRECGANLPLFGGEWRMNEFNIVGPFLLWRANTNDTEAVEQLRANLMLHTEDSWFSSFEPWTIAHYLQHTRITTAELLGHIGPASRQFIPTLTEMLADNNRDIRGAAAKALHQIGPALVQSQE
jgi:hypothetical protein